MKTYIKNIFNKYIGRIEYRVFIIDSSGRVIQYCFYTLKDVDTFVTDINLEKYVCVQKIEKIRRFSFIYNKQIIHSPLHFCLEDITEMRNCDNHDYSFPKKHESLKNIKYTSNNI